MIVAIPETVSHILLRFRKEAGQTDAGVFDLLANFEHIVFDEFHTISPRGFGLAGLMAKLAAEADGVRARVSFLSATPLDIRSVLRRLEVDEDRVVELHEELTDSGRPVHGDVGLVLTDATGLADMVSRHVEPIKREIGQLPNRAAYAAGLYWKVLMDHWSNRGARWEHLKAHQPGPAGIVYSLLRQVRAMESDRIFRGATKKWCDGFEAEAGTLRDIGARIRVVDERGRSMLVPELWLRRETDILERFPLVFADRDGLEEVRITGDLEDRIKDKRRFVGARKKVLFPHTPYVAEITDDTITLRGPSG